MKKLILAIGLMLATSPFALAQDKAKDSASGAAAPANTVAQQPGKKGKAPVRAEQEMFKRKLACEKEAAAANLAQAARKQYIDACRRK